MYLEPQMFPQQLPLKTNYQIYVPLVATERPPADTRRFHASTSQKLLAFIPIFEDPMPVLIALYSTLHASAHGS